MRRGSNRLRRHVCRSVVADGPRAALDRRAHLAQVLIQRQPSKWSCLPTAFAMVMNLDVAQVIAELGHDDAAGFHPFELTSWALRRGWAFVLFAEPSFGGYVCGACGLDTRPDDVAISRVPSMREAIELYPGVLTGYGASGQYHAVAWDGERVHDPNYTVYELGKFKHDVFFAAVRAAPDRAGT